MDDRSSRPSIRTDAGPFAMVPLWVLQRLNEGSSAGAALSVFVALHKWTNADFYGYPSHASIGELAGVSAATVKRGIKALEDIGALEVVPRWIGPDGKPTEVCPEVRKPERTSNGYFIRYAMPHSEPTSGQIRTHPSPQIRPDPSVQICTSNKTQFEPDPTELENTALAVEIVDAEVVDQSEMDFERWWKQYPIKKEKKQAKQQWAKLKPHERTLALEALPEHLAYWERERTETKFIPYGIRWLRNRRWEDELVSNYKPAMTLREQAVYAALQARHAQEQTHDTTGRDQIAGELSWDDEWVG